MNRKYTTLELDLPYVERISRTIHGNTVSMVAGDLDDEDLLEIIRRCHDALAKMLGDNETATDRIMVDVLREKHTFTDIATGAMMAEAAEKEAWAE